MVGAFGIAGENGNERKAVYFSAERSCAWGSCISSTSMYTRVTRGLNGTEVTRRIDLVLI